MKMKNILPILIIASISLACVCGGGQPSVTPTPPTPQSFYYEIIFIGESNSGGIGINTSATSGELAPNSKVQILNNTTRVFEDLDIGTNNLIGHDGLFCCSTHGWELQLANRVSVDATLFGDSVYLVKTGQGGTQAYHWQYLIPPADSAANNLYIGRFFSRSRKADSLLSGKSIRKVLFCSLGINDMNAGVSNDTFKAQMVRNINLWRVITKETTPVILTKFSGSTILRYNNSIDSIANNLGLSKVYTIDGSGSMGDPYHWNYSGLKDVADRFIDVLKNTITW